MGREGEGERNSKVLIAPFDVPGEDDSEEEERKGWLTGCGWGGEGSVSYNDNYSNISLFPRGGGGFGWWANQCSQCAP